MIHSPAEKVFVRGITYRLAAALLALLSLGLLFLFSRELADTRWVWGLGAAILLIFLFYWNLEAGRKLEIHPEGIVVRRGSVSRSILWESIRETRYRAVQGTGGGVLGLIIFHLTRRIRGNRPGVDEGLVNLRCSLKVEGERPLVITSAWSGAGAAVKMIQERLIARMFRESMEKLRSRGELDFGLLTLTSEVIRRGRKEVLLSEVEACGLARGRFFVKKQKAWGKAIQIPIWKIPNVFVLVRLLQELEVAGIQGTDLDAATQPA